jgi:CrcB protein
VSVAVVLGIGAIGGLGAIARFLLDGAVASRLGRRFPFGTLAVNLSGSFVLGFLVGTALSERAYDLLGTGLIGAFTTFSTWALESHRLGEDGQLRLGALNSAVSLALGVLLAWAGRKLGAAL